MTLKKPLTGILSLMLITFLANAQVNVVKTPANFGSDADTRANILNNVNTPGSDDWYRNTAGSGEQIIDTSGVSAILSDYINNPSTRSIPVIRRMHQPSFTVLNGNTLLDAIFQRDHHGSDSSSFGSRSNKNGENPNDWEGKTNYTSNLLGKNDILDAFAHLRRDQTDSLWMIGGVSMDEQNGSSHFDFELFQNTITYNTTTGQFTSTGPDLGHTAWLFDSAGNITRIGDVIFSVDLSSKGIEAIHTRIWVPLATLAITPATFNWSNPVEFDGSNFGGYAEIVPKSLIKSYTAIENTQNTWAGPFRLVRANETLQDDFTKSQFMEIAVNLTAFGIDPLVFGIKDCALPFKNLMVKTRSSSSFGAELKDFVGPIPVFDQKAVNGYTDLGYYCDSMPQVTLQVQNPNPNFIYQWHSPNGNIIGQTNGNSIVVDKPGIYYVTESITSACPNTSIDSVQIIFDSTCRVLDVDIIGFSAVRNKNQADLQWDISNNQDVSDFIVEYSVDGRSFRPAFNIPSNGKYGDADYESKHAWNRLPGKVYYRIRINGAKGGIKYSRIVPVNFGNSLDKINVFPNPAHGRTNIEFIAEETGEIQYSIYDLQGKKISDRKFRVSKGGNRIEVTELENKQKGIYMLQIRTGKEETNRKLIIE